MFPTTRAIPEPTLRRLPRYLHLLRSIEDRPVISSTRIGALLQLEPIQVRKDLACTGLVGRPKIGYQVPELIEAIEKLLGWNDARQGFIVGVGKLGSALLGYPLFQDSGLKIVAAFDSDPEKVGAKVHGRIVLPLEKLPDLARRMRVMVGVLSVPADAAQGVAELMVSSGIMAIWNFAPVALSLPVEIIVQNEDLYSGLAALSQKLAMKLKEDASKKGRRDAGK